MRRILATLAFLPVLAVSCGESSPAPTPDPGSLVDVSLESKVGVLLDDLTGSARDKLATDLLARGEDFWRARAVTQIETTLYRLIYRNFYYDGLGQLPLPPKEQWEIVLGSPQRETIDGHDLVTVSYTLSSTLLAPEDEPAKADPKLGAVGGVVEEPYVLPVDPELLLERTGYACMNEVDFPPNSVDTENAHFFFDDTCEGGLGEESCHLSDPIPTDSCVDALVAKVGTVSTAVRFERVAWDAARADKVRVGESREGGAQLKALSEGVKDNRIVYRYFDDNSCAIAEGCVGGPGWRRLLQFTATTQNLGAEDAALGDVGPESPAVKNRLVSLSACHQHMHFNHYGKFSFGTDGTQLGSKRAFCLESTSRYFNNEKTPLTHPYSCSFQGTAAGWGDDYIAGLDCQWVDITTVETVPNGVTEPLTFHMNPDDFLCEGELVRDASGNPQFEETNFTNEQGETESRFMCKPFSAATADNVATVDVDVPPVGGMVTQACNRWLGGDKRNCGFASVGAVISCAAGASVTVTCTGATANAPAAVRICEASQIRGALPCTYLEALTSGVQEGADLKLTFTCPKPRSLPEVGGLANVLVAPMIPGDDATAVTCMVN